MGRGVHLVAAALACACGRGAPAPIVVDAPTPLGPPDAAGFDAAIVEADAEPIGPENVLSGSSAEQVIASGKTVEAPGEKSPEPVPAGGPAFLILGDAVGPFRLGSPRADVVKQLAGRAVLQRVPTPIGEPSVEVANLPPVRLRIYAGRLQEIQVLFRDRRAVTDSGLGVGSTFAEATGAYGTPRPVREEKTGHRLGFVLEDLPGVILVPADPAAMLSAAPPPATRIARIVVVGPEATAEED